MAGAAVAPALGVISSYFSQCSHLLVQLIISIPAVFIFLMSFFFPGLCRRFKSRTLVLMGLTLYTAGGCAAGLFSNIYLVLIFRALVGVGVCIIMPLSTGLLSYYFPPEERDKLMGYSSAMNQMGGVIATLLSGILAAVSWRVSFLVYALGFFSFILCLIFLPNDRLAEEQSEKSSIFIAFIKYSPYVISMFLLMVTFFVYPANFAMETLSDGIIPQSAIAVIMAFMDFAAFGGGLLYTKIKNILKRKVFFFAPVLFVCGYLLLTLIPGWFGAFAGSFLVGFANGCGVPCIISAASAKAGPEAVSVAMPLISAALYLGQFAAPFIVSWVSGCLGGIITLHLPYLLAVFTGALMIIWTIIVISAAQTDTRS